MQTTGRQFNSLKMDIVESDDGDEVNLQHSRKMADDEVSDDDITGGYAYSWYVNSNSVWKFPLCYRCYQQEIIFDNSPTELRRRIDEFK